MDQYPFEIKLTIVGILDLDDFIKLLKKGGFKNQIKETIKQANEQMPNIYNETK